MHVNIQKKIPSKARVEYYLSNMAIKVLTVAVGPGAVSSFFMSWSREGKVTRNPG